MIAVIDYGAGNLRSVMSALRRVDAPTRVAETSSDLNSARAVILPGVGAAADTMENLRSRGLAEAVLEWIRADRPFFGGAISMR